MVSASAPAPELASRHDLDDEALGTWLESASVIPGLKLPVISTKIGYGQSNPTYFVDDATGQRYILRKKPPGTIISPVAHQVDREYRVLKALGSVEGFPVPRVYGLCMDSDVVGTPFYVMEFVKGRIMKDYVELKELSPEDRCKAWYSLLETLAWLHSIEPDTIGLQGYGKKTDFYRRQCQTFPRIEAQQARIVDKDTGKPLGRAHERYDEAVEYVRKHLPCDRYAIIHGDFKFDNVILHPTEPRVIAILDWELSTIGHPLVDLVFTTAPFWGAAKANATGEETNSPYNDLQSRQVYGLPDLSQLLDRYVSIVGYDVRNDGDGMDIQIARIFNFVRGATISHGIQARTVTGQASSDEGYLYFKNTRRSIEQALSLIQELEENKAGKTKSKL